MSFLSYLCTNNKSLTKNCNYESITYYQGSSSRWQRSSKLCCRESHRECRKENSARSLVTNLLNNDYEV